MFAIHGKTMREGGNMKLEFSPKDHSTITIEQTSDIQGNDLVEIWQDTESIFMRNTDLSRFIHELLIIANEANHE
jgi:hypothetical protein